MLKKYGFTLVELLIAALIFTVIILSIYSSFQTGTLSYNKIDAASQVYQGARIAFNRLESDLKNAFIYSDEDSGFKGQKAPFSLECFILLESYKGGTLRTNVSRIKYELSEKTLKRTAYAGLDSLKSDAQQEPQDLAGNVENISFEYAFASGGKENPFDWQESWPKEGDAHQIKSLPLAAKIKLSLLEKQKGREDKVVEFSKTIALTLRE